MKGRTSIKMASADPTSPGKPKVTCKGCGKEVQKLLSHLKRTKGPCKDNYDMDALEAENKRLHREQMATRNRKLYHDDPGQSSRKKAASRKYYKKHSAEKKAASKKSYEDNPEKKKKAMTTYNENHREDINIAMKSNHVKSKESFGMCPVCEATFFNQRSIERHIAAQHCGIPKRIPCDICEKVFEYQSSLNRHMSEVHGEVKHRCDKCPAAFNRAGELQKHTEADWHYLEFECGICSKNLVFKTLAGLIRHIIVKRPEEKYGESTIYVKKSGILLTCRAKEGSIQVEEGKMVLDLSREEQDKANRKREEEKEKYINAGLRSTYEAREKPCVELRFLEMKHDDDIRKVCCISCREKKPYSNEYCKFRFCPSYRLK